MAFKTKTPNAEAAVGVRATKNLSDLQIISNPADTVEQFRAAMHGAGIAFHGEIVADGQLHRGHVEGDAPGSRNLAYKLHLDGLAAGYFQSFKTGVKLNWKAHTSRKLTAQEVIAMQARIDSMRADFVAGRGPQLYPQQ